jgi:Flp pilus assembly protein TadB
MKIKSVTILLFFIGLPLLIVIILAMTGMTFNTWVYALLFIICPVIAVIIWFIYKDMEKKVSKKV